MCLFCRGQTCFFVPVRDGAFAPAQLPLTGAVCAGIDGYNSTIIHNNAEPQSSHGTKLLLLTPTTRIIRTTTRVLSKGLVEDHERSRRQSVDSSRPLDWERGWLERVQDPFGGDSAGFRLNRLDSKQEKLTFVIQYFTSYSIHGEDSKLATK